MPNFELREYSYTELTGKNLPYLSAGLISLISQLRSSTPELSIIVPVFNKESSISLILADLIDSLSIKKYEIIIIDDASDDKSLSIAYDFLKKYNINHKLFSNRTSLYETACDNIGFYSSESEWIIEVQSDIYIKDPGFDNRMIDIMTKNHLGSLSGRAGHSWKLVFDDMPMHSACNSVDCGLLGNLIFSDDRSFLPQKGDVIISETNNRGPWLLNKKWFLELGGLDSDNFFLGNDDHDFNFKCFELNKKVGYTPVDIFSIPSEGSTRQPRSGDNYLIYQHLKSIKNGDFLLKNKISSIFLDHKI